MVLRAGEAQSILDDVAADTHMKSSNFAAALERYNLSQTDPSKRAMKDVMDVRHQRFLQRHLTGSQEEQDEIFRNVMTRGDEAVNEYLRQDAQKVLESQSDQIAGEDDHQGLLQHGGHILKMSKDMHNLSDMIKSGRTTAQSLGLTDEQMEKLKQNLKHLLSDQSVMAQKGLRAMAEAGKPKAQEAARNAVLGEKKKGFFARLFGL
jgi:uncharacterized protein (UPF0147 family)